MGDISVSSKMAEMLKVIPLATDENEILLQYLKVYDRCRINRNALTHFTATALQSDPTDLANAPFVRMKGNEAKQDFFPSSLPDIRRVALELQTLSLYSWEIYKALSARKEGRPVPLPPLLALPELLVKSPPQTKPKRQQSPRPSRASRRPK
jgi:hypothetical protein